jgi:SAM-dependent methyltransferase
MDTGLVFVKRSEMYGSEKSDLLVKYYDIAFGISGEAELAWYFSKAKKSGGPILDMACGTGRLALLFARQGFEVTGIDQSAGMLNQFREKLEKETAGVRERIRIEHQMMADFNLGRKFNTVICCDAFFHNLTVEDEISCLERVAQHLNTKGRFMFNLPNPNCEFVLKSAASAGKEFEERGRYELEDGSGTVLVEQAHAGKEADQCIETTLRIRVFDCDGNQVEKSESAWTTRYLYRYEAVHLLYRCGFQVEKLVGDYQDGPVSNNSQLIFEAKLNDE